MGEEHENGAGLHDGFDENEDVSEDELVQIEDDGVVYNCAVLAIAESEGQEYAMLAPADQLSDAEEEGELLLFIVQCGARRTFGETERRLYIYFTAERHIR